MVIDMMMKNIILTPLNLLYEISPKLTLRILYQLKTGNKLHLDKPIAYTEKLQWIKLYAKDILMTQCSDKFLVRDYIKSCGCEELLNELYWEGFNPEDIPFDDLPDHFVIKVTHGSSFNIFCENKGMLNIETTIAKLKKWLTAKFLLCYGEWFYGVEEPRIIVEKYLQDEKSNALFDYKIFCFHGEPHFIYVMTSEDYDVANMYDLDFNFIPNIKLGAERDFKTDIPKPDNLDEMLEYARKLSKDFLHVRVDFYSVNGKTIFGELTFTKGAGFDKIKPHDFDIEMGSWLKLPQKADERY